MKSLLLMMQTSVTKRYSSLIFYFNINHIYLYNLYIQVFFISNIVPENVLTTAFHYSNLIRDTWFIYKNLLSSGKLLFIFRRLTGRRQLNIWSTIICLEYSRLLKFTFTYSVRHMNSFFQLIGFKKLSCILIWSNRSTRLSPHKNILDTVRVLTNNVIEHSK